MNDSTSLEIYKLHYKQAQARIAELERELAQAQEVNRGALPNPACPYKHPMWAWRRIPALGLNDELESYCTLCAQTEAAVAEALLGAAGTECDLCSDRVPLDADGKTHLCKLHDRQCHAWKIRALIPSSAGAQGSSEEHEELIQLRKLLDTPEIEDFDKAVPLEAAHQLKRWGSEHDDGKQPEDWFWLLGYLAGKALACTKSGNIEKAKHHCISSAAALRNWHAHLRSGETKMRPGIVEPASSAGDGGMGDREPRKAVSNSDSGQGRKDRAGSSVGRATMSMEVAGSNPAPPSAEMPTRSSLQPPSDQVEKIEKLRGYIENKARKTHMNHSNYAFAACPKCAEANAILKETDPQHPERDSVRNQSDQRDVIELTEWLRNESEELMGQAIARRGDAKSMDSSSPEDLRIAHTMAEKMAGRKLPSTTLRDAKQSAKMNSHIASKLEAKAMKLSGWSDAILPIIKQREAVARLEEAKWWEHLAEKVHADEEEECMYCQRMIQLGAALSKLRGGKP